MSGSSNPDSFVPTDAAHIEEYLERKNVGWSFDAQDCKDQALYLIAESRDRHNKPEERMALLAEAQVWATLATS